MRASLLSAACMHAYTFDGVCCMLDFHDYDSRKNCQVEGNRAFHESSISWFLPPVLGIVEFGCCLYKGLLLPL